MAEYLYEVIVNIKTDNSNIKINNIKFQWPHKNKQQMMFFIKQTVDCYLESLAIDDHNMHGVFTCECIINEMNNPDDIFERLSFNIDLPELNPSQRPVSELKEME